MIRLLKTLLNNALTIKLFIMKQISLLTLLILSISISANSQTQVICGDQPVPAGWITTAIGVVCKQLNGVNYYQKTIVRIDNLPAGAQVSTCSNDPLPPGWIIKSIGNVCFQILNVVPAITYFEKTIVKIDGLPTGSILSICSGDPVPCGWVTTETHQPACYTREDVVPAIRYFERIIQKIERVPIGTILQVCNGDFNPSGWTTIQTGNVCFERRDVAPNVVVYERTIQKIASISCCVPEFIACPTSPGNLVTNGEFCVGNSGFSTQYHYCSTRDCLGSNSSEGWYAIGDDAFCFHGGFQGRDHTTGSGNFLIVNGSLSPNVNIWCETINVSTNSSYNFSYWLSSMNTSNLARLQVFINGIPVGAPFTAPNTITNWQKFSAEWNSGSSTTATICITDQNTGFVGNDFGLDDISFIQTPLKSTFLSNLSLSSGTLTPSFDPNNTNYNASVANSINTVTVTPTAASATSTITVNGIPVTSGNASGAIPLYPGNNTITTVVTEQDGTTKNYTIIVNRAASPGDPIGINSDWVWIKGDNTINPLGMYGIQGISAPANNPIARHGAVSWTDNAGNLWLFGGGYSPSVGGFLLSPPYGLLNDLWKYNSTTKEWTWMKGDNIVNATGVAGAQGVADPANKPGARAWSVSWKDIPGNLWLYGGSGYGPNYLWKYDPNSNQWTWLKGNTTDAEPIYGTQGNAGPVNTPGVRSGSVSWTDASGNLWLFGGKVTFGQYAFDMNDLWKYDISTNQWTWISGDNNVNAPGLYGIYGTQGIASATNKPGARNASVSWTDASGNFWLFGGSFFNHSTGAFGDLNDLWKYDPNTNMWTWMKGSSNANATPTYGIKGSPSSSNDPGARDHSVSWKDGSGNLWLFGGSYTYRDANNFLVDGLLNDVWKYDPSINQWIWMKGDNSSNVQGIYGTQGTSAPGNKPGSRVSGNAWASGSESVFLFGGGGYAASGYGSLNDLWKLGSSAASGNAYLCNIAVNTGTLLPSFLSNITSYNVSVPNSVSSITIIATACEANATVKVDGNGIIVGGTGTASASIPLAVGINGITVELKVPTEGFGSYTVKVTRAGILSPPTSNSWYVNDNNPTGD
jgi:hypothetical protein